MRYLYHRQSLLRSNATKLCALLIIHLPELDSTCFICSTRRHASLCLFRLSRAEFRLSVSNFYFIFIIVVHRIINSMCLTFPLIHTYRGLEIFASEKYLALMSGLELNIWILILIFPNNAGSAKARGSKAKVNFLFLLHFIFLFLFKFGLFFCCCFYWIQISFQLKRILRRICIASKW